MILTVFSSSYTETINAWIGYDINKFKIVYRLRSNGDHSDSFNDTQKECPLYGAPEWLFDKGLCLGGESIIYFRHKDKGFFACSSYSESGEVNEILRRIHCDISSDRPEIFRLANREMFSDRPILEIMGRKYGNRMLKIDGFSFHRPYATFVSIPPTSYTAYDGEAYNGDGSFYCCDNHKTFSHFAKSKINIEGFPIWLPDILLDCKAYSRCLSFTEMTNGTYYRYYMWMEKRKEKGIVETKDESSINFIKYLEAGGEYSNFTSFTGQSFLGALMDDDEEDLPPKKKVKTCV